jgi:hypothetical protein
MDAAAAACATIRPMSTTPSLDLLVLGGTVFLGRHVVEAALSRGHRVTVFNRGRRTVAWDGPVEALVGDRDGDTSALRGRRFDALVDCSGYRPSQIASVAESLGRDLPIGCSFRRSPSWPAFRRASGTTKRHR